ncbi:MAG TPA: hypothetical protein VNK03_07060 [Gammaproteobacteria bacterium]|nr:hypothetical protein [Gammaproteobacteria bacterium]
MNEKKQNDDKVFEGSWKDVWKTLVHIVLAICVFYAVYSFFRLTEMENGNSENTKAGDTKKQG